MMYAMYQFQSDVMDMQRTLAGQFGRLAGTMADDRSFSFLRPLEVGLGIFAGFKFSHTQPAFDITSVTVAGQQVTVSEETVAATPFGSLLHFRKQREDGYAAYFGRAVRAPRRGHG